MALVQTLQDAFDDGVRDPSLWNAYGSGLVEELGGKLNITTTTAAAFQGYYSVQQYDGTGSYTYIQLVTPGDTTISGYVSVPLQWNDYNSTNQIQWQVDGGSIRASQHIGGVDTTLASATYNSVTHKFIKIRESAGTTYWDYSSDGLTWVNLHSVANPMTITKIYVSMSAGNTTAVSTTTTTAVKNLDVPLTGSTLDQLSQSTKRKISESLQVSWKKDFRVGIIVFTIGTSTIGGNDIIGGSAPIISAWNKYLFYDETQYLLNLNWEQQLNMPLGGISMGMAGALLDNTSGRFLPHYMGGNSEIATAVLPRRPFIINAGFYTNGVPLYEPQFVGELSRNPLVSVSNKTAQLQGEDFITYLKNKRVDNTAMFTGQLSSTILESVLHDTLGLATSQYELEQGINRIPFSILENDTLFFDFINSITQAELGQFFQDENGILRFWNRQHWDTEPYSNPQIILATSDVIEAESPDVDHIINVVEVKANPLEKQTTTIFTLQSPIELSPGRNDVWVDFDNPVIVASTPSRTANTQSDGSGADVTSSVTLSSSSVFVRTAKYVYNNATGATAYITALTISGRWAVPIYTNGISRSAQDDSSVTAYDERPIAVENDYIQDEDWANSYAQLVLSQFAEPDSLQTLKIRAKPTLHQGDVITWQSRDWIVFSIANSISPEEGYTQDLQLLKKSNDTFFRIGISIIGWPDKIAA